MHTAEVYDKVERDKNMRKKQQETENRTPKPGNGEERETEKWSDEDGVV